MYSIAQLPLRKSIKPGVNPKLVATWSPEEVTAVDSLREEFTSRIDRLNEAFTKDQHRAVIGKDDARDEVLTTLTASLERYAEHLINFVAKHPTAAQHKFYFWGASITERLNHAFADYRYELLNCYACVGLVYHEAARFVLEIPSGSPLTEAMEKDGYANLCFAAGYLQVAATLSAEMSVSPLPQLASHDMLEESKTSFLECLRDTFLEEAQWVGLEKALRNESNKNKEIVPKLTHRALNLANSALEVVTKKMNSSAPVFKQFVHRLRVRFAVVESLVYAQTAPCRFDASPGEALWFAKTAEMNVGEIHTVRAKVASQSDASSKRLNEWAIVQSKRISGAVDRIRQMNSLVCREKMGDGPFPLPQAQELARSKPVALPRALPPVTTTTQSPPPSSGGQPQSSPPPQQGSPTYNGSGHGTTQPPPPTYPTQSV